MLFLLQVRRDQRTHSVPIAELSAASLERALLATSDTDRQAALRNVIRRDPFLAAWLVFVTSSDHQARIHSLSDAAAWLADGTAAKLAAALPAGRCGLRKVADSDARAYAVAAADATPATAELLVHDDRDDWRQLVAQARTLLELCPWDGYGQRRLLPAFAPVAPRDLTNFAPQGVGKVATEASVTVDYLLELVPGIAARLPALIDRLCGSSQDKTASEATLIEQKLAALKELAYGASHEINNPLANIAARAQALLRDETLPDRRRKLSAIFDQAMRAHEMIADLMLFARPPERTATRCNLTEITREIVAEAAEEAERRQVELRLVCNDGDVVLDADPLQLSVAITALVRNAVEAVGQSGHVEIKVQAIGNLASVVVSDDGPGMSERVRHHLFDPFFSGREAGRGLGFGLSKCWRIVTEHGGTVDVNPIQPHGSAFTISLPRRAAA